MRPSSRKINFGCFSYLPTCTFRLFFSSSHLRFPFSFFIHLVSISFQPFIFHRHPLFVFPARKFAPFECIMTYDFSLDISLLLSIRVFFVFYFLFLFSPFIFLSFVFCNENLRKNRFRS